MVVSRVQHLSPLRRNRPLPRATAVSKVNQASVRPLLFAAWPVMRQFDGLTRASTLPSMAAIASLPSQVLMFQVNATRSRQ